MQCGVINLSSPRYLTIRTIFVIKMLIMNILIIAFNPSHVHPTTLNVTLQPPSFFLPSRKKSERQHRFFLKSSPSVKPILVTRNAALSTAIGLTVSNLRATHSFLLSSSSRHRNFPVGTQWGFPLGCCNFTQFVCYLFECVHGWMYLCCATVCVCVYAVVTLSIKPCTKCYVEAVGVCMWQWTAERWNGILCRTKIVDAVPRVWTLCWEANCKVSTKRSENTVTKNSPFIHTGEVTRTKTIFNSIKMPIDTLRYHYKVNVVAQCSGYRIMTPSAFDWFAIKLAFTMRLCLPPGTKWSLAWFYLLLCLHDRLTERINTFVPCCW